MKLPLILCLYFLVFNSTYADESFTGPNAEKCTQEFNKGLVFSKSGRGHYHMAFGLYKAALKLEKDVQADQKYIEARKELQIGIDDLTGSDNFFKNALNICPSATHPEINKNLERNSKDKEVLSFLIQEIYNKVQVP